MTPQALFVDYEGEGGSTMTRNPSIHRSPFSHSLVLLLLLTFIGLLAGCSTASTGGSPPPSVSAMKGTVSIFTLPTAASDPTALTAGPDGNVWFAEVIGGRIGRITPAGEITEFALGGSRPGNGITLGPDGNLWFTDFGAAGDAFIGRITPSGAISEFPLPRGERDRKSLAHRP